MESMDFDNDGEHNFRSDKAYQLSEANTSGRDLSDMDIDAGLSPAQRSSSPSFDHISHALSSVLSLGSDLKGSAASDNYNDKQSVPPPSAGSQRGFTRAASVASSRDEPSKTPKKAAVFKRNASEYGIPVGDTVFSQYPGAVSEDTLRKRQQFRKKQSDSKDGEKCEKSSITAKKKLDVSGKHLLISASLRKSSCRCVPSCLSTTVLLLTVLVFIGVYNWSLLYSIYEGEKCKVSRSFNKRLLEMELDSNVFGQHLATKLVPDNIEKYFSRLVQDGSPQQQITYFPEKQAMCKPLVLSFDGWTGVGKNYVSKFVSESFRYSKVSHYVVPLNFPHESSEGLYQQLIGRWVLGNTTQCEVHIVVLDEMDKASWGLCQGLIDVIHHLTQPCATSPPVIFLLLSNSHASEINRTFLKHLTSRPAIQREELSPEHFRDIFTQESDVWSTDFFRQNIIDASIPFLPLEHAHVIQCIRRELVSRRFSTDMETVTRVLQELSFSSFGEMRVSQTGCKRVAEKVDLVIYDSGP